MFAIVQASVVAGLAWLVATELVGRERPFSIVKPMATKDFRELLKAIGCEKGDAKGSHQKWTAPGGHSTTLKAGDKERASGTVRSIQAALAPEFGYRWLEEKR